MPRLLIYDIGHVENFGDRMVHEVVTTALGSRLPGLELARMTSVSIHDVVPGYYQLSEDDWVELGNQCDMILILGGSVFFNDRTLALDLTRLDQVRVPLVIWGGVQNPDWLRTEEGRERVSRLAEAATRVFYRFPGETEVLGDLVPGDKLVLGGDPCLLFPAAHPNRERRLALALSRYLIQDRPELADELSAICRALGEHYELLAVWCEASDATHFRDLLPGVQDISGYAHILAVLRNCEGVMGCRLHPLVVGASQHVPVVGWEIGSRKIRWFMEALSAEEAVIELTTQELSAHSAQGAQRTVS